jgi:hypothetical protein
VRAGSEGVVSRFAWSCIAIVVAGHALAAEDREPASPASPAGRSRSLGGHVFIPSRLVQGPFTATSFGMSTIVGGASATAPRYDLDGNVVGTRDLTLAAVGIGLDLDVAVVRDLSLRLRLNGVAYTGTSGDSLLSGGATASYGAGLGATWGRTFGDKRVALVFDTAVAPELSVVVANAVINALRTDRFEEGQLFTDVTRIDNRAGVSFGWGLGPAFGLAAEARYHWSRRVSGDVGEVVRRAVLLGVSLGLDLDPPWRVPIGVTATYLASLPTSGGSTVHETGAGVFYTRRPRLALGVEVTWSSAELRPGIEPPLDADSVVATIRMRYYW